MDKYLFYYYVFYILVLSIAPGIISGNKSKAKSKSGFIENVYKVVSVAVLFVIVINAFFSPVASCMLIFEFLNWQFLKLTGLVFMHIAFVLIIIAQYQMGESLRVGIDENNPPEKLVTEGLFSVSRNPIYLSVSIFWLGFFLTLPSALTLFIFIVGIIVIKQLIKIEEAFLYKLWDAKYENYKSKVRCWL